MTPELIAWALVGLGGVGIIAKSVTFVRVTLPENFGANPGFGAYEVTVVPWWAVACVGIGMPTSLLIGWVSLVVGAFALGCLGQALAIAFRGKE